MGGEDDQFVRRLLANSKSIEWLSKLMTSTAPAHTETTDVIRVTVEYDVPQLWIIFGTSHFITS